VASLVGALVLGAGAALAQPYGQAYDRSSGSQEPALSSLHAALNVTAAQEGAWRAFVAASQPDPQQQARQRAAQQMLPRLTAPQRVDLSIAEMRADLETLRQRGAALKVFYAALTPAQRAIFDRQTLPRQNEGYGG
jgi:hypothetical protein